MTQIVKMIGIECNTHKPYCSAGAHECIFFTLNENYNICNCGAVSEETGILMDIE
jgi:hypothetical protein